MKTACVVCSVVLALALASYGGSEDPLAVGVETNGNVTPGMPVRYEHFDAPRLDELRHRESLETVVADGRNEFEGILLLKNWVAAQWPHSTPDPIPPWDAIVILDWIRSGKTGGSCGQYSQVLLQSLAAIGLTARYVELGSIDNPYAHFVIEVWSNQFNKWIVLDADYNMHFERKGVPLSALEVHDALVHSELSDVVAVRGAFREGHDDPGGWPLETAELYYYLRCLLKADHLSVPNEWSFNRFNDTVEWEDDHTTPWEFSKVESPVPKVPITKQRTSDWSFFESSLNQVNVIIEAVKTDEVQLRFENNVHQFQRYQLRELAQPGADGVWFNYDSAVFLWKPSLGARTLEVRGVNIRGVPGPSSVLRVAVR